MSINTIASGGYRARQADEKRDLAIENAKEIGGQALTENDPDIFVHKALTALEIYGGEIGKSSENVKIAGAIVGGGVVATAQSMELGKVVPLIGAVATLLSGLTTVGSLFRLAKESIVLWDLKHEEKLVRKQLLQNAYDRHMELSTPLDKKPKGPSV